VNRRTGSAGPHGTSPLPSTSSEPEAIVFDFARYPATVVLQPTPLCNLRCRYCYLPDLSNRGRMDPHLARRLAREIASWPDDHQIEVLWHGGEPLTTGQRHLAELIKPFEGLRAVGQVRHGIQTNATLLSQSWCSFIAEHGITVGVSIDGPRWANNARRTLSGAETFERSTGGIERLRAHGILFSAIAVVRPALMPAIIERTDEYLAFFASIGAREVGFNIEEQEGNNVVDPTSRQLVDEFWQALLGAWTASGVTPRIRDFDRVLGFAQATLTRAWHRPLIDPLPTISYLGDVVLLSPELAGHPSDLHRDFVVGNIGDEPLLTILERAATASYVAEFQQGSRRCRDHCPYFDYCQAGQAANRYFEHGDFLTNETTFCRHSRQAPFDAVVGMPATEPERGGET
jgi:uncharacterized protein